MNKKDLVNLKNNCKAPLVSYRSNRFWMDLKKFEK